MQILTSKNCWLFAKCNERARNANAFENGILCVGLWAMRSSRIYIVYSGTIKIEIISSIQCVHLRAYVCETVFLLIFCCVTFLVLVGCCSVPILMRLPAFSIYTCHIYLAIFISFGVVKVILRALIATICIFMKEISSFLT